MVALDAQRSARIVVDVDDPTAAVTHVITTADEHGQCRRTLKYMLGILRGAWIVSYACTCRVPCDVARARLLPSPAHARGPGSRSSSSGITASAAAGKWLPERPFEIQGDTVFGKGDGPARGRLAAPRKVRSAKSPTTPFPFRDH